jgi:hypothetical protein
MDQRNPARWPAAASDGVGEIIGATRFTLALAWFWTDF